MALYDRDYSNNTIDSGYAHEAESVSVAFM